MYFKNNYVIFIEKRTRLKIYYIPSSIVFRLTRGHKRTPLNEKSLSGSNTAFTLTTKFYEYHVPCVHRYVAL